MYNFRIIFYKLFPKGLRNKMGKSRMLKPFRDTFFRKKGTYREIKSNIKRQYLNYNVEFEIFASIQVALKAKERGIENTLLRYSIELLKKRRNGNDDYTVFDVGTNFGYLSLVWANSVCENGKVYSFEPHPNLYKSFINSINSNQLNDRIVPENVAIGNYEGTLDINLVSTTANINAINDKNQKTKSKKVDIITLDNYVEKNDINKCDLIKIDVDGIELEILKGSEKMIRKFQPVVIVETNNDFEIIDFFKQINYKILNMKLEPIIDKELPLNIFCIPS